MEQITLERAVEVVRALTQDEQRQLRQLMDSWQPSQPVEATAEQQRHLAEALLKEGLIDCLPAHYEAGYDSRNGSDHHPPVSVKGRPVSETLLEDREPH